MIIKHSTGKVGSVYTDNKDAKEDFNQDKTASIEEEKEKQDEKREEK